MRVYIKTSPLKRFNEKWIPHPRTGCWIWTAATRKHPKYNHSYGVFADGNRRIWKANRFSWVLHNGSIPDGLWVLHRCDNPLCVNPDHLFVGTPQDNSDDMKAKGRQSHGEFRPRSKLSWEQIREIRDSNEPAKIIAARLGVCATSIYLIRNNKTWRGSSGTIQ